MPVASSPGQSLERLNRDDHITFVNSGEEVSRELTRLTVGLLMTDLRLPGISGLERIRPVRISSPRR